MTTTRRASAEPADIARAGLPLVLLLGALVLPGLAGIFLLALVGGVVVAGGRRAPVVWAWAATLPAAAMATLDAFGPAAGAWDAAACSTVVSPPFLWALAAAALVVALTATLAVLLKARAGEIGARRPPRYAVRWAAIGGVAILGGGLAGLVLLGPLLDLPAVDPGGLGFVVPALVFAMSLATAEEVAWRGALQGWLARSLGPWVAVLIGASLYGVSWGVGIGSPIGGIAAGVAGLALGATVVRSRSLAVALTWHAAFNVPLYLFVVCRTG